MYSRRAETVLRTLYILTYIYSGAVQPYGPLGTTYLIYKVPLGTVYHSATLTIDLRPRAVVLVYWSLGRLSDVPHLGLVYIIYKVRSTVGRLYPRNACEVRAGPLGLSSLWYSLAASLRTS